MKAAIIREWGGRLEVADLDIAEPLATEVLIRTVATSVCHSDVGVRAGQIPAELPLVLGHEAAGVVEAVGLSVTHVVPGDHVITSPDGFCGQCEQCLAGASHRCTDKHWARKDGTARLSLDGQVVSQFCGLGSFANRMLLHEGAVAKIDPAMPLDRAALLGCGAVTGLGAALNTAKVGFGDDVAVIGCGGVGLSAIQGAKLAGARTVIAIDRVPEKLELARRFGATEVVDASATDPVERVVALTNGGVDHALECVGAARLVEQAWAMTRLGGQTTSVGVVPHGDTVAIPGDELIQTEKRLTGSTFGSSRFRLEMPRYVELFLDGDLQLDGLIGRHRRYAGLEEAVDDLNEVLDELDAGTSPVRSVFVLDDAAVARSPAG